MPLRNLARLVAEHSSLCNRESYRDSQSGDSLNQGGHHAWSTDANHEFCGLQKDCKKRTAVVRSGQLRIHTFWARSLWFNASGIVDYEVWEPLIPEDIYIRLVPVLELASAMLDLSDEFMTRILCAPTLTKHHKRTGKDHVSLDPEYEVTEADRMKYKQFLCQLPDYQRVYFGHSASHFGSEGPLTDASCLIEAPSEEGPFIISYKIGGSFIDFYTHTDWMKFSEEQIRLVNFQLALVLVHEFAHGVGFARAEIPMFAHKMDSDEFRDQTTEFLFHPDHYHNELGYAWEHYFFGVTMWLADSHGHHNFTDLNTVLEADCEDLANVRWSHRLYVTDDIVRVLSDNIHSSTLATDTLARVAADGKSLQLIKMASNYRRSRTSKTNEQKLLRRRSP